MFIPSQVKAKLAKQEERPADSELVKAVRNFFKSQNELKNASVENTYQPHRYVVDTIHKEPPRILLGSKLDEAEDTRLFRPEPAVLQALGKNMFTTEPPLPCSSISGITHGMARVIPTASDPKTTTTFRTNVKTFLDFSDDEEERHSAPNIVIASADAASQLHSLMFKLDQDRTVKGGLFGFSQDLPKLSRISRHDDDDESEILKQQDDKYDEDFEEDGDDDVLKEHVSKRQKMMKREAKIDHEESMLKREK
jgi:hypothetical protein